MTNHKRARPALVPSPIVSKVFERASSNHISHEQNCSSRERMPSRGRFVSSQPFFPRSQPFFPRSRLLVLLSAAEFARADTISTRV